MSGNSEGPVVMKVEMKTINISDNSKKQIVDTLKFIRGNDFLTKDRSSYRDKGLKLDRKYWIDSGKLVIQGMISAKASKILLPHEQVNLFATNKLKRYGFNPLHCVEALRITAGDVGLAFELLMSKYFDIALPDPENVPPDILEERAMEMETLKSIYDFCEEKIANQLWVINLELPYLTELYEKKNVPETDKSVQENKVNKKVKKELCKYFMKGHCRYQEKCRFSHEVPPKERPKIEKDEENEKKKNKFEMEVRFPSGCQYPKELPLVAFTALSDEFPKDSCLRITRRLLKEARINTANSLPVVFELIDLLLNRQDEVIQALKERGAPFYDPDMKLFPRTRVDTLNNDSEDVDENLEDDLVTKKQAVDMAKILKENKELQERFKNKHKSTNYQTMMVSRRKLPAWKKKEIIIETVKNNQVVVISGETGCGKSTQVPQYLLDNWLENNNSNHTEIVCTQPRRLSAIGVAQRVASERNERIAESVGYQIRLETKCSSYTRLWFCTTGILLRRLEGDPLLSNVTHIIVDEVHERSEEIDFLLMILKDLLPMRKDLKVILMSATLNANLFCQYFGNPPMIEIPGRTFPVEQYFLEDILDVSSYVLDDTSQYARKLGKKGYSALESLEADLEIADMQSIEMIPNPKTRDDNLTIKQLYFRYRDYSPMTCKTLYLMDNEKINNELIEAVLTWIISGDHDYPKEGTILVFLPGIGEITSLHDHLRDHPLFSPKHGQTLLVPLHSSLTNEEQSLVFKKVDKGVRKIVLSTNIAETSITIDDCVYVVDTGKMKEKRFDSNKNMESLDTVWVSRANALQRKGRAGRVMPGVCIHLYTKHCYEYNLISQPVPEIHRVPLEQLLLKIKMLENFESQDIYKVLGKIIEPPSDESIGGGITRLRNLGAFTENCDLTALGHHLASLPVDVRIGKLILYGTIFCCVDSALTIAACLSYKSPFVSPFDKRDVAFAKKKEFFTAYSDHLTILKAYKSWMKACESGRSAGQNFASENYLSYKTLTTLADIKTQFLELLISIGFIPSSMKIDKRKSGVDRILEITGHELNCNGENQRLLSAILCTSLYPNIVKVLTPEKQYKQSISGSVVVGQKAEELKFETKEEKVAIHPSSVNHNIHSFPSPYLVYQEKIKTSRVFIRDCTLVPVLPLVLFSPGTLKVELCLGQFVISIDNGWIMFTVNDNEIAELMELIKQEFLMLLDEKIKDPKMNLQKDSKGKKIISTIVYLVTYG